MTGKTAADPHAQWLQMARQRVEQTLQTTSPVRLLPDSGSEDRETDPSGSHVERRSNMDRRVVYDRRELIRFEDDRRSGVDRRAGNDSWEIA